MQTMIPGVDSSEILPNLLWQSAAPPTGSLLQKCGFGMVALCAFEYQPPAIAFPGIEVVHAPNLDDFDNPPTREMLTGALAAANQLVAGMRRGQKVLSTCRMGVNRSGLVTALALVQFLGVGGAEAIRIIRQGRHFALSNPQFCAALERIPAKGQDPALAKIF